MIRATIKLCLFAFIALFLYGLFLFKFFMPQKMAYQWRGLIMKMGSRLEAWVLGIKINVSGNPPKPPFIVVSNHLSYVDILVLMTQLNGIFISKKEVRLWPGFGMIAVLLDTIFIDREKLRDGLRVNELVQEAYELGKGIIFFPEGTSSSGAEVLTFSPVLLASAARLNYPVHTVSIQYQTSGNDLPAHLAVCWWGDMRLWPHLKVFLTIPRVEANLTFGEQPVYESDPRALAGQLHAAASRYFRPTDQSLAELNIEKEVTRWK